MATLKIFVDEQGRHGSYDNNSNTNYNLDVERRAGVSAMGALAPSLGQTLHGLQRNAALSHVAP